MKEGLFEYIELLSQDVEGKVARLSIWLGIDVTWPLVILVGIVLLVGMFFPDKSVRK